MAQGGPGPGPRRRIFLKEKAPESLVSPLKRSDARHSEKAAAYKPGRHQTARDLDLGHPACRTVASCDGSPSSEAAILQCRTEALLPRLPRPLTTSTAGATCLLPTAIWSSHLPLLPRRMLSFSDRLFAQRVLLGPLGKHWHSAPGWGEASLLASLGREPPQP